MKPKVKRIIAREGLIVVFLMSLAGISFFLHSWLSNQKNLYKASVQEIEPVIRNGNVLTPQGVVLEFPKHTKHDVIEQTIKRDFPTIKGDDWIISDTPTHQNVTASYNEKGEPVLSSIIHKMNFFYACMFFLVFSYPLYLLVRFVVWAIVTLKGETTKLIW